jgi:tetratricopeptide (TPR) repeat protein
LAGLEKIRKLQKSGSDLYFDEPSFNAMGYYLMNRDKLSDAIEVFKLNVEMFPKSFNVYDSLGEAYMKAGNKKLAVKNYKKSLELNPQNKNAKEMLQTLGK